MFRTLIEDQPFDQAPGTVTDFSQWIDLQGVKARYVRIDVDTANGLANWGDPFGFVGLSEVQFFTVPPPGITELETGPVTHYFRTEFEFIEDPARTDLQLDLTVDDGAVIYLNGTELYRYNMPPGEIAYNTTSLLEIGNAAAGDPILLPATALIRGPNVLSVEVHQSRVEDTDMFLSLELTSITAPPEPVLPDNSPLVINEVAAADRAAGFFIELANQGDRPFDTSGIELVAGRFNHRFREGTSIAPGELVVIPVNSNDAPSAGEAVFVYDAARSQLLDSMLVMEQGRGRRETTVLFTEPETPGAVNQFQLQQDIVINEIMYHHRATTAGTGGPATPYTEIDEEWIELFNRGTQEVDLSGWQLRDAVDYQFPEGTRLAAGAYLVVANDALELRSKYPLIADRILGDFAGNLSNQNDRIVLIDQAGNPADLVEYFESGDWPSAADGNGSSLELTNPDADNSSGTAWAASVESDDCALADLHLSRHRRAQHCRPRRAMGRTGAGSAIGRRDPAGRSPRDSGSVYRSGPADSKRNVRRGYSGRSGSNVADHWQPPAQRGHRGSG